MTDLIVTHAGSETWVSPSPNLVVTQAGSETWATNSATNLRVTQVAAEVWTNGGAALRVTQVCAEVWIDQTTIVAPLTGVSATGGAGTVGLAYDGLVTLPSELLTMDLGTETPTVSPNTLTGLSMTMSQGTLVEHAVSSSTGFFHSFP